MINKIIFGDSVKNMEKIPDNSIDLTVTSPPYDNLRTYKGAISDDITFDEHFSFPFIEMASELYRITKDGGIVVWVVNDQIINGGESGTSFRQALKFQEIGFKIYDTMIYHKNGAPFPETGRYSQVFEYMFVFLKGKKPNTVNIIKDKENRWAGSTNFGKRSSRTKEGEIKQMENFTVAKYGSRYNVWYINNGSGYTTKDKFAYGHPAMFPESLAEDHILSWSKEGDTVLDPMCGCFDESTEILTKNGWKYFKDLNPQDKVSSIDINGYLNYETPKRIIKYHYEGEMYHFTNYHFDILVTPDHNNYCKKRNNNKFEFIKSIDIRSMDKMKTSIGWKGKNIDKIILKDGCDHKNSSHVSHQTHSKNELRFCLDCNSRYTISNNYRTNKKHNIEIKYFLRLLGLYLSEGWVSGRSIYISQKKDKGVNYIKNVLDNLNINYDYNNYKFRFHNIHIRNYFIKFGHRSFNKFIIDDIKELSSNLLELLLEGLVIGDGSSRKNGFRYWSSSKKLIDDVQEISLKCGYSCNVHFTDKSKKGSCYINDRLIKTKHDGWYLTSTRARLTPKISYDKINIEKYNGMVYCVEVSDPHLILVRRNGKVVVSGNSGTTCKMAKLNNRNFIGIDINQEYVDISNQRIENIIPYTSENPNPKSKFILSREDALLKRKKNIIN